MLRLFAAATVGAALASAGMALQGLLRNPLAEPYILGISSGAGVGVLAGLAVSAGAALPQWAATPVLALIGSLLTCAIVYGIAQRRGRLNPYVLLLSGVIVNAFNVAIMLAIFLFVPPRTIADFTVWAMGGVSERLAITNQAFLFACAAAVAGGWCVLFVRGTAFNALGLGDDVASSVGVPVTRLRIETFLVVAVMTSAAVMLAGPIGFLGLIVPQMCRLVVGSDHRGLVVVSAFAGAVFLMAVDTACRVLGDWLTIGVLPAGIVTALTGGPFFIYLLRTRVGEGRA
jgi:iron complex transport system permease protein